MKGFGRIGKIIPVFLCAIFLFSVVACQKKDDESGTFTPPTDETVDVPGGIHTGGGDVVPVEGAFIVKDGRTDYAIVADAAFDYAAGRLKYYLAEATGVSLPIVRSNAVSGFDASKKYLSIGQNALSDTAGVVFDKTVLGTSGFIVRTVGNSVFMGGVMSFGNIYSVFEFLYHAIDFDAYGNAYIYFDKRGELPLLRFDITEVPDFEWRQTGYASLPQEYQDIFRSQFMTDIWMIVKGAGGRSNTWHNFFEYFPKSVYLNPADPENYHPEWYSAAKEETGGGGEQLSVTAQGNEASYALMVETAFQKVRETVLANPQLEIITFTQNDNNRWCESDATSALYRQYGTHAAGMIKIANDIGKKLSDWIASGEDVSTDRHVELLFFAYAQTVEPPVKTNPDGTYAPMDDSVVCAPNVNVLFAPIGMDYTKSILHESNKKAYDQAVKWSVLSSKLYLWLYQTNFSNYLFPYNSWSALQNTLRFYNKEGATLLFNQGQYNNHGTTAFDDLKNYLNAKLQWNVNRNTSDLIDKYFDVRFGPASATMKEYFNQLLAYMNYLENYRGVTGSINFSIDNKDFWPKSLMDKWYGLIEKATAEIAVLQDGDPARYKGLYEGIVRESMFIRYCLIIYYHPYYSDDTIAKMRADFAADADWIGLVRLNEGSAITNITSAWQ
ncbi:MAG: DUF4838 domain-containing protein [Clostridiales bacterium]|jgi:hypothetical protein|nr:DUF4838 domain-containing protein [Clostridiales bacterium]